MAIKSGVEVGTVAILTTDTTAINFSNLDDTERYAIQAMSIHNTTTATVQNVEVYISPDLTSASGVRVANYSIAGGLSRDVNELIGQGVGNKNIIVKGGSTGCNITSTVLTYNAGD